MDRYILSLPLTPVVLVCISFVAYKIRNKKFRRFTRMALAIISAAQNALFVILDGGNGLTQIFRSGQKAYESIFWAELATASCVTFFAVLVGGASYALTAVGYNLCQYRMKRLEGEGFWQFLERRSILMKKKEESKNIAMEGGEVYE